MNGITKTIKFYKFEALPSLSNNGITPMTTIEVLNAVFAIGESYNANYPHL